MPAEDEGVDGVFKAELTVTVGAVDWAEVAPRLSVTVAVIDGEPDETAVYVNVEVVCPL